MLHKARFMTGRDGTPVSARRAGPARSDAGTRGVIDTPTELAGSDDKARLEDFRRQMREIHGLDMSRD